MCYVFCKCSWFVFVFFFNANFRICYFIFLIVCWVFDVVQGLVNFVVFFLCCTCNCCDLFVLMHAFSIALVSLWFCAIWFVFTIYLFVLVVLLFICFWSLLHVKILTCFFLIHFASFMILNNLDVAFFSCVQLLVTLQGCFVDLHIMFLYFGVSDINLLPHHFSYFFYVFFQFLLL
jgi:hypothetical protein